MLMLEDNYLETLKKERDELNASIEELEERYAKAASSEISEKIKLVQDTLAEIKEIAKGLDKSIEVEFDFSTIYGDKLCLALGSDSWDAYKKFDSEEDELGRSRSAWLSSASDVC